MPAGPIGIAFQIGDVLWQLGPVITLYVAGILSANLALALSERGARVVLVDGDLAQANLDLLLGLHPRYDIQHVLDGQKTLDEIVVNGPNGLRLIPAASGNPELADLDDFRREKLLRSLGTLDGAADIILIDTASGVSKQTTEFCRAGHDVLVVTTPEMTAGMTAMMTSARRMDWKFAVSNKKIVTIAKPKPKRKPEPSWFFPF